MKFIVDHDYHIHSCKSACSDDPNQTPERILQYAVENNLKHICLTDHFWDDEISGASNFYSLHPLNKIKSLLPLPQADGVKFHFGCEADMNKDLVLGLLPHHYDEFEFINVALTHFHMGDFTRDTQKVSTPEERADWAIKRVHALLDMDLPFEKVGIAHFTVPLIANGREEQIKTINSMSDDALYEAFGRVADKGVGVELNFNLSSYEGQDITDMLRPYRIAKDCGCKFFMGSDAHHPEKFNTIIKNFNDIADALELSEDDKFKPFG
ncbi:MAG: PHP domain-containing protein [Clostridiales bacterium]|nr:PHP domain-containing protein [Clostridiales bacterium]